MATSPRKPKTKGVALPDEVPITNPQGLSAVYSNHFGMSATLADFTIYFLEMGQIPGPDGSIAKQELKAIVTLPFVAAAGMMQVLQQTLQQHSQQVAEIQKQMTSGKQ